MNDANHPDRPRPAARLVGGVLSGIVLPAAVLFAGWLGVRHLLDTAPQPLRKARPPTARPVEVVRVAPTVATPIVEAMGTVRPAREVRVRAQVAGRVETVARAFEAGGQFDEGAVLLRIDRQDHELARDRALVDLARAETSHARAQALLAQAEAAVAQRRTALLEAQAHLRLEEGNQAVARRELEMLGGQTRGSDPDLVLRKPQLAIAKAQVDAALAGLEEAQAGVAASNAALGAADADRKAADLLLRRARLDLERTELKAPFNAWVRERHVEVGAVLGAQTDVATLIGTDAYWVEVLLPKSDLRRIDLPAPDARPVAEEDGPGAVRIRDEAAWGPRGGRTGRLVRLLGDLEDEGRMVRVLVEVRDPLHLRAEPPERRPLIAGSYVRVEIPGRAVPDVVDLDRALLRHGDVVWVADAQDRLAIRTVRIAWRGRRRVLVEAGLVPGERVLVTDLAAPVAGMALAVTELQPDASPR